MHRFVISALVLFLAACSSLAPTPTPTLSAELSEGIRAFNAYCSACHSTNADTIVVGPSLAGIATKGGERIQDMDAEMYIRKSILEPDAYTVEGFPEGMMPIALKNDLTDEEMEAVIRYLLTLE